MTPERLRILVDTNILLRAIQHENPLCAVARKALQTLHRQNRHLCLAPRQLVAAHNVLGVKVHDARLVAAMKPHGVNQLLTFNASDFTRYDGTESVDPQAL